VNIECQKVLLVFKNDGRVFPAVNPPANRAARSKFKILYYDSKNTPATISWSIDDRNDNPDVDLNLTQWVKRARQNVGKIIWEKCTGKMLPFFLLGATLNRIKRKKILNAAWSTWCIVWTSKKVNISALEYFLQQ
jgi:hypothetical protein